MQEDKSLKYEGRDQNRTSFLLQRSYTATHSTEDKVGVTSVGGKSYKFKLMNLNSSKDVETK